MKVAPSLLHTDLDEFSHELSLLAPYFKNYQIDVTDGKFVASKTLQLEELINKASIWIKEEVNTCCFDFDLMVEDYEKALKQIEVLSEKIKIRNIFIHLRALKEEKLPQSEKFIIGIALDPPDEVADLESKYGLNTIPVIQIMSVTPGAQGSPFLPEMLNKITQLKQHNYRFNIFLDGAINSATLPLISTQKYLPDWIGPGSFLSKAADSLMERINYLKKIEENTG